MALTRETIKLGHMPAVVAHALAVIAAASNLSRRLRSAAES
jgi:hypothetical protein